jgi:hypothetical protein
MAEPPRPTFSKNQLQHHPKKISKKPLIIDLIYPTCKSDLLISLSWQLSKDLVQAEAISLG